MPPKKASSPQKGHAGAKSEQEKAAMKIQAVHRGNAARKEVAQMQSKGGAKGGGAGKGKGAAQTIKALDRDGDGNLSKAEVKAAVAHGFLSQAQVDRLDRDHDGSISKKELDAAMAHNAKAKAKATGGAARGGLAGLDKDGDGTLSKAEVKAAIAHGLITQAQLDRMDKNHDGAISRNEMEAAIAQQKGKGAARAGLAQIKALDKDGDGTLSKAEVKAAVAHGLISQAQVDALDKNHDGAISRNELEGAIAQQKGKGAAKAGLAQIKALDRDGDGSLSKAEVKAAIAAGKISEEMVRRLDVNHDGSISKKELDAAIAAQQKGKGAAKGAAPAAAPKNVQVAAPKQSQYPQYPQNPLARGMNAAGAVVGRAAHAVEDVAHVDLHRHAPAVSSNADPLARRKDFERKYEEGFRHIRWAINEPHQGHQVKQTVKEKEAAAWIMKEVFTLEKIEAYQVRKTPLFHMAEAYSVSGENLQAQREDLIGVMARGYVLQTEKDRKIIQTLFREFLLAWVNKQHPDPHAKKPTHQIENLITIVHEAATARQPTTKADNEACAAKMQSEAIRIMEHDPDELIDIFTPLDGKQRARFTDALVKAKIVPESKKKELKELTEPGGFVDQVQGPLNALHYVYMNKWVVVAISLVEFLLARWLTPCGDLMSWLKWDSVISFCAALCLYGMCLCLAPIYVQIREDPVGTMSILQQASHESRDKAAATLSMDTAVLKSGIYFSYATAGLFLLGAVWATWSAWSLVMKSICLFSCQCRICGLITCWFFVLARLVMFWGFINFTIGIKGQVTKQASDVRGHSNQHSHSYGSTGGSEP